MKIIDYKSGNTSFSLVNLYHGLQLQLVVYMNAALELEEKRHPGKKAEPAGIFYYHIQNPIVDGLGNETEAEIRNSVLEQIKIKWSGERIIRKSMRRWIQILPEILRSSQSEKKRTEA